MERVEAGMMAVSRAGHDKDTLYLILRIDGDMADLSDGRLKPKEKPKKKRLKHLQVIRRIQGGFQEESITNEEIRYQLKEYQREVKLRRELCQKQT